MNTEELKALQAAAATLKRGDYYLNLSASLEESPTIITRATLAKLADKSINELDEARASIEAHALTRLPFPPLAEELFSLLEAGRPEWLSFVNEQRADNWEAAALAILVAAGRAKGDIKGSAPAPKAAYKLDKEKIAGLFLPKFTNTDNATGLNKFDLFYNQLSARAGSLTTTDFGRIAYQIRQSEYTKRHYRENMKFAEFLRLFFEYCGMTPPKDQRPKVYKTRTKKSDFTLWL